MRAVVVVALILALFALAAFAQLDHAEVQFTRFIKKFNRNYEDHDEYKYRLGIFKANLKHIDGLNAKKDGATYGITQFTDMTLQEFKDSYLMKNLPPHQPGPVARKLNMTAPQTFDWRSRSGVVTPVYNQGQCGSCWAFSATEAIESRWALAGHGLVELSMQQIVDCDTTDAGCDGGWPYNAYAYVISAGGMDPLSDYPYTAVDGQCAFNAGEFAARLSSWQYVTQSQDEGAMVNYLVQNGPLSVCVDASSWSYYTGGVYPASSCGTSIDHCVQAVGYDLNNGYWIIRNSWGTSWGLSGYMQLQYGQDACAVAQVVTSPIAA